jgi:hypothetical protein
VDVVQKSDDQAFDENFIGVLERLPTIGDKFGNDAIIFSPAGFGAILSEIDHFSSDANECPICGFVMAVFWQLFSFVSHSFLENKVSMTLFTRISICLQISIC